MGRRTQLAALGVTAAVATALSACSVGTAEHTTLPTRAAVVADPAAPARAAGAYAVADPGSLDRRLLRADVLVLADRALPQPLAGRVSGWPGVRTGVPLSVASVPVAGRTVTLAAVDPASYRRFTPRRSARADAVWQRVAAGDLALRPDLAGALRQPLGGDIALGNRQGSLQLRVGAFTSLTPGVDAVVNHRRGVQLGMPAANALLVATRAETAGVVDRLERTLPRWASVHALEETGPGLQTAFLTGGSVAAAVGSFHYRYFPDGTVEPDPAWVAAHIRTETVPILGAVTCHQVMLPQLRAALQDVVDAGLAAAIDPGDYGGCYVPRFIAHDPEAGLSLHTWGIAVDLNVQNNLRGTVGEMDRRVVEIFQRWGFGWGGDWAYTDPMHFELAALVRPG